MENIAIDPKTRVKGEFVRLTASLELTLVSLTLVKDLVRVRHCALYR